MHDTTKEIADTSCNPIKNLTLQSGQPVDTCLVTHQVDLPVSSMPVDRGLKPSSSSKCRAVRDGPQLTDHVFADPDVNIQARLFDAVPHSDQSAFYGVFDHFQSVFGTCSKSHCEAATNVQQQTDVTKEASD